MCHFNDVIRDLDLEDIPLKNRTFTWSSKRPEPALSRLDKVFLSRDWSTSFPVITSNALEMTVSDHAPLLLHCRNRESTPREPKIEIFWLRNPTVKAYIHTVWQENPNLQEDFDQKLKQTHMVLRKWHTDNLTDMEKQLDFCKKVILFFDTIEEKRQLLSHEFKLRNMVRERAFMLANYLEQKWRHRSTCRWLREGDKNSRFFHNLASARLRRNMITNLQLADGSVTQEEGQIREAFLEQMKGLLGKDQVTMQFQPESLYSVDLDLSPLVQNFTEREVHSAIKQLGTHRASGPDGVPNEFLKWYWPEIKKDILQLVQDFYDEKLDLAALNKANIILVPKKEIPETVHDYRPISVINVIPKLISKLMANRMRGFLPDLISPRQTAFIRGRQITENFNATREVLHHLHKGNRQAIFAKLDFKKAFDSVSWSFLERVLQSRGFHPKWIR